MTLCDLDAGRQRYSPSAGKSMAVQCRDAARRPGFEPGLTSVLVPWMPHPAGLSGTVQEGVVTASTYLGGRASPLNWGMRPGTDGRLGTRQQHMPQAACLRSHTPSLFETENTANGITTNTRESNCTAPICSLLWHGVDDLRGLETRTARESHETGRTCLSNKPRGCPWHSPASPADLPPGHNHQADPRPTWPFIATQSLRMPRTAGLPWWPLGMPASGAKEPF